VTGIITNAGFRDIFEIARGDLPRGSMYDFRYVRPPLLVRRRHTVGVPGRIDHRGKVVQELDHDAVIEAGRILTERGVDSVAVCFLHSYANAEHEKAAKSILAKAFPHLSVSVSVDLVREYREYERTSTAVADAYIRPILGRYLTDLEDRLREGGLDGSFLIMRSAGGAMTSEIARVSPLLTVFSGPAGGIAGTISLGEATGRSSLISFDVGGTSLDACVIVDGAPTEVYEAEIESLPIRIPVFDIRTIGAGGSTAATARTVSSKCHESSGLVAQEPPSSSIRLTCQLAGGSPLGTERDRRCHDPVAYRWVVTNTDGPYPGTDRTEAGVRLSEASPGGDGGTRSRGCGGRGVARRRLPIVRFSRS